MLTSHELFGFMSAELSNDILQSAFENDKELYKATLKAVADARKLRPIFFEKQPKLQRHASMVGTLSKPNMELAAGTLLRGWLLKKYNGMLVDFLNALDIPHKDGVVEDLPEKIDDAKLKTAVDILLGKYPREVVAVYLNAFNSMNETGWDNLEKMLSEDSRVQVV
ncbi:MAG TPA: hypothetical protein VGH19_14590 [Verrucomicrobiae bacterium]